MSESRKHSKEVTAERATAVVEKLTAAQRLAVTALVSGGSRKDAADAAGVTESTVSVWKRDEAFRDAVDQGAAEVAAGTMRKLAQLGTSALSTLDSIHGDDTNSPGVRAHAAGILLGALVRIEAARQKQSTKVGQLTPEEQAERVCAALREMDLSSGRIEPSPGFVWHLDRGWHDPNTGAKLPGPGPREVLR